MQTGTTPQPTQLECAQHLLAVEQRQNRDLSHANEQLNQDNFALQALYMDARKEAQGLHFMMGNIYTALTAMPTGGPILDQINNAYHSLALQHGSQRARTLASRSKLAQNPMIEADMFAPLLRRLPQPGLRLHYSQMQQEMGQQRQSFTGERMQAPQLGQQQQQRSQALNEQLMLQQHLQNLQLQQKVLLEKQQEAQLEQTRQRLAREQQEYLRQQQQMEQEWKKMVPTAKPAQQPPCVIVIREDNNNCGPVPLTPMTPMTAQVLREADDEVTVEEC